MLTSTAVSTGPQATSQVPQPAKLPTPPVLGSLERPWWRPSSRMAHRKTSVRVAVGEQQQQQQRLVVTLGSERIQTGPPR